MSAIDIFSGTRPLVLDGAMGTMLFQSLPSYKGCFELLNIDKPDVIEEIHRKYVEAGATVVETNSFGGSKLKLSEYNLADRCFELNKAAVEVAKKATSGTKTLVGGSIGPTGLLIEPIGETTAETVYESFQEQARGLAAGSADLIIVETMNDIQEARLALLAVKSVCDLPVACSMTFEEDGRTVTGTDMVTAFATLAQCGADMVGSNCSMGPEKLLELFQRNKIDLDALGVPLCVWANAGLPVIKEGKTHYPMAPKEFAELSEKFFEQGLSMVGGCCGTSPLHITELKKVSEKHTLKSLSGKASFNKATSRTGYYSVEKATELIIIGERLNPTARKAFKQDLQDGKWGFLREQGPLQVKEGAHLLDINVGVPELDEVSAMKSGVTLLSQITSTPLVLDSDNLEVLEKGLLANPGVPIINSINGKEKSLSSLVPLVKRYGSFVVALCLDDTGIHHQAGKRIAIGEAIISRLAREGIDSSRIFIDPLMLAESAEPGSAVETLKVINHFAVKGIKTSIGLSNVSFGLPQRKHINNAFLKLAIEQGLTAAIVNPAAISTDPQFSPEEEMARTFLTGADPGAAEYIKKFSISSPEPVKKDDASSVEVKKPLEILYSMVVEGNDEDLSQKVDDALKENTPQDIMNTGFLSALEKVGQLYSTGEYFLPQMIASANTMKKGFEILKPLLKDENTSQQGTVIICTVKGDIHDIGKNIVAMMLENHGFTVYDLGKDIDSEDIIAKAKEVNADIICLSSLLTTTMTEMKAIKERVDAENLATKLILGGAVVTPEYAQSIGAYYGEDAVEGVKVAKNLMSV